MSAQHVKCNQGLQKQIVESHETAIAHFHQAHFIQIIIYYKVPVKRLDTFSFTFSFNLWLVLT